MTDLVSSLVYCIFVLVLALHAVILARITLLRIQRAITLKDFHGAAPHWFWGNVHKGAFEWSERGLQTLCDWQRMYGGICTFWQSTLIPCKLLINKSQIAGTILNKREEKDGFMFNLLEPLIGDGLISTGGVKWQSHRKLLTPLFHFNVLEHYVTVFNESINTMLNSWSEQSGSVEITKSIGRMTLDSFHKCMYGSGTDLQLSNGRLQFIQSFSSAAILTADRMLQPLHYNDFVYRLTDAGRKFYKLCAEIRQYSFDLITEYQQKMESQTSKKTGHKSSRFMEILCDARDEDGNGMSDMEISDEVATFVAAGHETTSNALVWCFYHLAKHPNYQEKCRQEINSVLGGRSHITWDDMSKFVYLTQCINESLRLAPVVPLINRKTTRKYHLEDGRCIPEGVILVISIFAIHRDPDVWIDPDIYDPERFSLENQAKIGPYDFIPFSAGPRNCLGKQFAMNELKTCMALAIKRFYFEVDESVKVEMYPVITMRSKNGVLLKLTPI